MKTLLILMYLSGNVGTPINAMSNIEINRTIYNEAINLNNIQLTKTEMSLYFTKLLTYQNIKFVT